MEELERNHSIKGLKTPNGKEIGIYRVANTALYRIAFVTGGEVPRELEGMFTAPSMAAKAIEAYLKNYKPRKPSTKKAED